MKINEVECLVGISKKNIRFYEQEGLLSPVRNRENGYREYSRQEVDILMRIKLLRKLGLPLEEIRRMQAGNCTVSDAMRRHMITMEREQKNLEQSMELCRQLIREDMRLSDLNAQELLEGMERMEKNGASFHNGHIGDVRRRYVAPAVSAVGMIVLMLSLTALGIWGFLTQQDPPPAALMAVFLLIPAAVIGGVSLALRQRWSELKGGEEDEAKKY